MDYRMSGTVTVTLGTEERVFKFTGSSEFREIVNQIKHFDKFYASYHAAERFLRDAVEITGKPTHRILGTELVDCFEHWKKLNGFEDVRGRSCIYDTIRQSDKVFVTKPGNKTVFVGAKLTMRPLKRSRGFSEEPGNDDLI